MKHTTNQRVYDSINCSPNSDFTAISNQIIRNNKLSGVAKAVLSILLSNKKGWKSHVFSICKYMKESEKTIRKALSELESVGYLLRVRYRSKLSKKFVGSLWLYTDTPNNFNKIPEKEWGSMGFEFVIPYNSLKLNHDTDSRDVATPSESPINSGISSTVYNNNTNNKSILKNTMVHSEPLKNEVDSIILLWNSFKYSTRHTIPDKEAEFSKTYKQIYNYITALLEGKPLLRTKSGEPFANFRTFIVNSFNEPPEVVIRKKWTTDEIKEILISISNEYGNKTPKNLQDLLWNNFHTTKGNKGFSLFLYFHSLNSVPPKYRRFVEKLSDIISVNRVPLPKQLEWARHIHQELKPLPKNIWEVLEWYSKTRGEAYIPYITDGYELVKKFQSLLRAFERNNQKRRRTTPPVGHRTNNNKFKEYDTVV
jgi:predicted transcriptional regulator